MALKISARDKRFIIVGAVAVGLFVLVKFFISPAADKFSGQKESLAFKEATVAKYTRIIGKQDELQKKLKLLKKDDAKISNSLLKGETPSLSAADIQKTIDRIATSSSIEIQSVKVMDSGKQADLVTVPIQVRFTTDLSRMKNFVYSIETGQKLLTIPNLKISVRNRREPREVIVTVVICGFMKKETKG